MVNEAATMDERERDAFLGVGGTGVISFAGDPDEPPHTVPVSYGYDADTTAFFFRLAVGGGSEKADAVDRPVSFVTYERGEEGARSVVATGTLEHTSESDIATETLAALERVHIPIVDIFERPPSQVDFEFYRLVPDTLEGRTESSTAV
ncbi:pyridoxamine 5'-phosphate oxidase family protein [Haloparvum alkalitolerans]|uniref:pyridoxamine 5'-phosphate oxidase family protein n=1 Tax=Haloparvum alkalitolerans TaxID=1042953 RepID=UPI003CF906B2